MTFSKLFIIFASVAVSVSALAAPQVPLEADVRADAAAHTGDGTFYTRTYSNGTFYLNNLTYLFYSGSGCLWNHKHGERPNCCSWPRPL